MYKFNFNDLYKFNICKYKYRLDRVEVKHTKYGHIVKLTLIMNNEHMCAACITYLCASLNMQVHGINDVLIVCSVNDVRNVPQG